MWWLSKKTRTLPTIGEHSRGPQISRFMSITGTPVCRAAYSVGGCRVIALEIGTSHLLSEEEYLTMHSGSFWRTSGVSRIATTEIPACLSCVQYRAIPAPTSASADGPPLG